MSDIPTEATEGFPELFRFKATTYRHPAEIHHWVHRECAALHGWDGRENPTDEPSNDPDMVCQVCGRPGTVEDSQQIRFLEDYHNNFLGSLGARRFVKELREIGIECEGDLPGGASEPVPDPRHEHLPTPLEQRLIDGGMYAFGAHEHAGRTYSDGPMTPRLLAERLMMVPSEFLDEPMEINGGEDRAFRLYGQMIKIDPRKGGYFDCPPRADLAVGKFKHGVPVTSLEFPLKSPRVESFWRRQEEILAVHAAGAKRDRYCDTHERPYSSKRWDECPHCLRASGLTPEEVRTHIKEAK